MLSNRTGKRINHKKGHLLEDIKVVEFDEEGKSCFARK